MADLLPDSIPFRVGAPGVECLGCRGDRLAGIEQASLPGFEFELGELVGWTVQLHHVLVAARSLAISLPENCQMNG